MYDLSIIAVYIKVVSRHPEQAALSVRVEFEALGYAQPLVFLDKPRRGHELGVPLRFAKSRRPIFLQVHVSVIAVGLVR